MNLQELFVEETGCLLKTYDGHYTDEYVEWLEEYIESLTVNND